MTKKSLIQSPEAIEKMRVAGKLASDVLVMLDEHVRVGISTEALNQIAHDYIVNVQQAIPAPLNYNGFPKSICTSINHVVCHGIPGPKKLLDGDIVNIDITTILDGYYADASRMFLVGNVSTAAERLVKVARECMELGIAAAQPWHFLGDIGAACEAHAHANGYSVVTELGGHGVGKSFHEEPFVPHVGEVDTGMLLVPGMVLTVEPMINAGKYKVVVDKKDGWTVTTKDKSLSAQWEKTILITETGTEVLSS